MRCFVVAAAAGHWAAVSAHPARVDQGCSKIEALPPSLIIRGWICSGAKTQIIGSQSQDSLLNPS